jgi:hypothetical protein
MCVGSELCRLQHACSFAGSFVQPPVMVDVDGGRDGRLCPPDKVYDHMLIFPTCMSKLHMQSS